MSSKMHAELGRFRAALLLLAVLALTACAGAKTSGARGLTTSQAPTFREAEGPPGQSLGAMRVTDPTQLVGGPAATGRAGDFLLFNDVVKVVISHPSRGHGFALSGGNLVDADRLPGGNDQLSMVFTYLENTFPRQFVYDRIYLTRNGSDGQMAEVVVTGVDSKAPQVIGVTRYQIEPGLPVVRILTDIYNYGGSTLRNYEVGDSLQWGLTEHYVPGYGTDVSGRSTTSPWVSGVGEGVSYGMTLNGANLVGPHGNGWTDVIGGRVNLARGAVTTYERYFIVGTGDSASVSAVAHRLQEGTVEVVSGRTTEASSGKPVAGARIEARLLSNGKPFGFAESAFDGRFSMALPPSEYQIVATHRARGANAPIQVDLTRGPVKDLPIAMASSTRLLFRVEDQAGVAIPAKLTFEGVGETPSPDFGHKAHLPGALNVYFSVEGAGEVELPPGTYQVTASRGIEYSIQSETLELLAGQELLRSFVLTQEVDTGAYLSADLHQHTLNSSTSWVQLEHMAIANLCEGVEIAVATDLNYVSDLLPVLQSMGLESRLKVVSGQEVPSREFGSFITFPVEPRPDLMANGAFMMGAQTPQQLFDTLRQDGEARVIMVSQPREGEEGYFNLLNLDPHTAVPGDKRFSFGFNTLEVFSGKRMKDASAVLRDWFILLNKGYAFTATGNSDSRTIVTQERGYPRNYLGIYADHPGRVSDQAVVAALRDRRDVMVTNGPFIRATINGLGRIGSQVKATPGPDGQQKRVELNIEVQAASWIQVDEIEVVANGEVVRRIQVDKQDGVLRYSGSLELLPTRDTWYVVIARGSRGMEPVVPRYKGTTITPFAFTNPIWVDVDGDGNFQSLFPHDDSEVGYVDVPRERVD